MIIGHGTLQYAFFGLLVPAADCKTGASTSFSFKAQATMTNNCFINTQALAFGPNNRVLRSAVRTVGVLSVQCTANNPYMIPLNGGTVRGKPAARQMLNTATGERLDYEISGTLDGALWGDGSAGTSMIAGTGTGAIQTVRMYGKVPPQRTASAGKLPRHRHGNDLFLTEATKQRTRRLPIAARLARPVHVES